MIPRKKKYFNYIILKNGSSVKIPFLKKKIIYLLSIDNYNKNYLTSIYDIKKVQNINTINTNIFYNKYF